MSPQPVLQKIALVETDNSQELRLKTMKTIIYASDKDESWEESKYWNLKIQIEPVLWRRLEALD